MRIKYLACVGSIALGMTLGICAATMDKTPTRKIENFAPHAFDNLRMMFDENVKFIESKEITSGIFSGMVNKIYGYPQEKLPRMIITLKDGKVFAFERVMDASTEDAWSDLEIPGAGPLPIMAMVNTGDIKALTGFYAIKQMDGVEYEAFKSMARGARKLAMNGQKKAYRCGLAMIIVSGDEQKVDILYVPRSTWKLMRLQELSQ